MVIDFAVLIFAIMPKKSQAMLVGRLACLAALLSVVAGAAVPHLSCEDSAAKFARFTVKGLSQHEYSLSLSQLPGNMPE